MANIPTDHPIIQQLFARMKFPAPVAELIGFDLVSIEPGMARFELQADERHANPMGTLHGGILCDVADAAMGVAYLSQLQPGETFTTLELKINFLKPVWKSKLTAVGRVVKSGRTVGLVECDIFDEKQSLVARASCTQMTLRDEKASGR
ncbi:MAG TPA: PaaI family thioesterase [Aggregatilineales bacterium]|nr:PaaI family thioesterase [Aggregatilineales bacterium]